MKKAIVILVLFCVAATGAFAINGAPNLKANDMVVNVGLSPWPLGINGGFEYVYASAGPYNSFSFGVATRLQFAIMPTIALGVVLPMATVRFGLGSIPTVERWAQGFDFHFGLGLAMGLASVNNQAIFSVGILVGPGIAYHFDNHYGIYLEGYYVRIFNHGGSDTYYVSIGMLYKL